MEFFLPQVRKLKNPKHIYQHVYPQSKMQATYQNFLNRTTPITKYVVEKFNRDEEFFLAYFVGRMRGTCEWLYTADIPAFEYALQAGASLEDLQTFVKVTDYKIEFYNPRYLLAAALKSPDPLRSVKTLEALGGNLEVPDFDLSDSPQEVRDYIKKSIVKKKLGKVVKEIRQMYGATFEDHTPDFVRIFRDYMQ